MRDSLHLTAVGHHTTHPEFLRLFIFFGKVNEVKTVRGLTGGVGRSGEYAHKGAVHAGTGGHIKDDLVQGGIM